MAKLTRSELEELVLLKKMEELPHLYGWDWYEWAWKFHESTNRFNFLCAANQISKSSTQIRKAINWATNQPLWPKLWRTPPTQFWYLYPTKPVATTEFHEKWEPEFLPRGTMKDDKTYGWTAEYKNKEIWAIHFNSGTSIYFKTYEQDTQNMQTGTVYAIFADEELPFEHFQELRSRLNATNGYFHMVFTATLGQDEWRRTMEPADESEELFRGALKLQVSMYDCLSYRGGKKSFWTLERIKEIEMECATEAEVQKRVYGRFVVAGGLKCQGFNRARNLVPHQIISPSWHIYTGTDIGSGGEKNHPAAHAFLAVRPDFKYGIIFKAWRGDGVDTASNDILKKHIELCTYEVVDSNGQTIKKQLQPVIRSYDHQARDFFIVSMTAGVPFTPADKRRDVGENMLSTLFKLGMLSIMEGDAELAKLVVELTSLKVDTPKTKAKDDLYDATRYAVTRVPWDFQGVAGEIFKVEEGVADERTEEQIAYDERRSTKSLPERDEYGIEEELSEWQDLLGT